MPAPFACRAIAFGFSDLSVAVIPAEAGIQRLKTRHSPLDSRFRGNDRGEKGNSIAKCDCPAFAWGDRFGLTLPKSVGARLKL